MGSRILSEIHFSPGVEACKGGSRKLLAPIMTRFSTFRETSILIVERRGRDLVDDDEQDLNTVLVRPFVEDIWGTWAWDVPEDHELWELRECLSQLVESRPADIRVFCSSWALHCKENSIHTLRFASIEQEAVKLNGSESPRPQRSALMLNCRTLYPTS